MKWNILFFVSAFVLFSSSLSAQTYPMNGNPITDCDGFFTDSGGNDDYGPNENFTTVICPDPNDVGSHIYLYFSGAFLGNGDALCFFDGEDATAPALGCAGEVPNGSPFIIQATAANPSGCVTVVFTSDGSSEGAGWSADIDCIAECQLITSVLESSTPAVMPIDTGYIDICPGERVFFNGAGEYPQNGVAYEHSDFTSNFVWDFGDGTEGYGPNVSHTYDNPGGYIVQLTITDQNGCSNNNLLSQRIRVSTFPNFNLGELVNDEICAGDTVELSAIVNQFDPSSNVSVTTNPGSFQTAGIQSDSIFLPDGSGVSHITTINLNGFSPGQILTDINDLVSICANMEHSFMGDLEIELQCPNGNSVIFHEFSNGGGTFLGEPVDIDAQAMDAGVGYDYCWTPNATNGTWIEFLNNNGNPNTLPAGDYNSLENLNGFLGCPLNGDWTLTVTDNLFSDNGFIFFWTIEFDASLYPNIEIFEPAITDYGWNSNPTIFFETQDSIAASPENAGTAQYTFTIDNDFGCTFDTIINVSILPETHPDCYSCLENIEPPTDTTVCVGDSFQVDVSSEAAQESMVTEVTFESYPNYAIGAGNHPPANPYQAPLAINSVNPPTIGDATVDIISVCLDLDTDFDADIQLILESPNGQQMELSTNNGGGGDNYTGTCFTPNALTPIVGSAAPFTGDFQPEGDWSVLNGEPTNGEWKLRVSDAFGVNSFGELKNWSITFRSINDIVYTWLPPTDLSCIVCPDPIITPSETQNYTISTTDSYGCASETNYQVEVLDFFDAPAVSCVPMTDGSIIFSWTQVGSISSYEVNIDGQGWEVVNDLQYILANAPIDQNVTIEVRVFSPNLNCGTEIGTSTCSTACINMYIEANSFEQLDCFGDCDGQVIIDTYQASSPVQYSYTSANGLSNTQNNGNFTGLCADTYFFVAVDAMGCIGLDTFLFEQPEEISITAEQVQSVSCFGEADGSAMAIATGGSGNLAFVWDDNLAQTSETATLLPAGFVNVIVTDDSLCTASAMVEIIEPTELIFTSNITDVSCMGESTGEFEIMPSGGTYPYTYSWQHDVTEQDSLGNALPTGNFAVTVTDANGCQIIDNQMVNEPATAVSIDIVQDFVPCFGLAEGIATATPMGGTGTNYTFAWDNGDNTATANALDATTHQVTISDENSCETVQFITIQELEEIIPNIIAGDPTCADGNSGSLSVNFSTGGVGDPYTYAWSNGIMDAFNGGLSTGEYIVTATDAQGCEGIATRTLQNPEAITASISGTDALCFGEQNGEAIATVSANAQLPITYTWDNLANNQTTQTATDLGFGTYTVTITDDLGCQAFAMVDIGEPEEIRVTFDEVENECFGEGNGQAMALPTGGVGGFSFEWSNDSTAQSISNLFTATYYLTTTDANGCMVLDSVFINQPDELDAAILVEDVTCFGDRDGRLTLTPVGGTPPFLYSTDNENFYGSSTLIGLEAGDYTVNIQDGNGCIFNIPATVNEPPALDIFFCNMQDEVNIELGEDRILTACAENSQDMVVEWIWQAPYDTTFYVTQGQPNQITTSIQNTIDYTIIGIDEKGCEDEAQIRVNVIKPRVVEVPTGFAPNDGGDSKNDWLHVHGKEDTKITKFQVFDRWGNLVYEATDFLVNDLSVGWDGTFRGQDMPPGVYIWFLEAEYIDGLTETYKGNTTLIR